MGRARRHKDTEGKVTLAMEIRTTELQATEGLEPPADSRSPQSLSRNKSPPPEVWGSPRFLYFLVCCHFLSSPRKRRHDHFWGVRKGHRAGSAHIAEAIHWDPGFNCLKSQALSYFSLADNLSDMFIGRALRLPSKSSLDTLEL